MNRTMAWMDCFRGSCRVQWPVFLFSSWWGMMHARAHVFFCVCVRVGISNGSIASCVQFVRLHCSSSPCSHLYDRTACVHHLDLDAEHRKPRLRTTYLLDQVLEAPSMVIVPLMDWTS